MKNILLAALLVAVFVMPAKADVAVEQVIKSSITVYIVDISSGAVAAQADAALILMARRKVLAIQNIHATATLWCGEKPGVTVSNGRLIAANGGEWVLNLAASAVNKSGTLVRLTIYCVSDLAGSGSNAAVTQAY